MGSDFAFAQMVAFSNRAESSDLSPTHPDLSKITMRRWRKLWRRNELTVTSRYSRSVLVCDLATTVLSQNGQAKNINRLPRRLASSEDAQSSY